MIYLLFISVAFLTISLVVLLYTRGNENSKDSDIKYETQVCYNLDVKTVDYEHGRYL